MRLKALFPAVVAVSLAGVTAEAQTAPEQGTPGGAEPMMPLPAPQDDGPVAPELERTPDARQAHLDELFRQLADAEGDDWQRVQGQIIRTWNRSGSDSMDLLARRADKAIAEEDFDAALLHLDDLVRLAPDFAEGWNKRATVHFMREDYGPSLSDIAHTLKLEPRHFGALSGLGLILDRIGDSEGALEAYRRAIAIHPNLPGIGDGIRKLERQIEGERL